MLNWKETYQSRLLAAKDAVKQIKSGDHVVLQHACGEPRTLIEAMVERKDLRNVAVSHMAAIGPGEYAQEGFEENFRHNAFFAGAATRKAIHDGRADYTSCFFHELPRAYREHVPPDIALIQVSPPNKWGYCSLGISVDYTKHVAEVADVVIAQVNEKMPKTFGDSFIHVKDIDYFVESTRDLIEIPIPTIGEVEQAIGENVARLIEDGSTLQLGIGAIPDAVLNFLHDKKDLGIHTEMFSDGVIDLVEKGIINGKAKNLHQGKIICSFVMGTSKLYDFVDDNPGVEFYTVDYTNDPYVIGKHDKMISINSAIQVDMLGQVCADTIGYKQYSAVGGQVDFVRGTSRSRGGKAIIAMPSTAGGGKYSRIVNLLDEGAAVTTSRYDVQFVVTEYGVADLRVRTNRQRAEELIKVAHPNFRSELKAAARQRKLF
ncbi:4-hydroxybutyrate CoA-transferase [Metallumcola ferriviriculae]|uniref:4-hydroxybutyrate CoA-transferase n=1 Tax=Metallumcola ferriviriculae TaxID=3039180 RepID=A0AAU0UPY8_9FIRM|nr:4-hydroxybutyrate CoA-transferase [Desulfitibacteraceae bacterium MK1]